MSEYNFERLKADERKDKREKALIALGIVAALILLCGIITAVTLNSRISAERFQEFRMACLEKGGSIVNGSGGNSVTHQCVRTTSIEVDG